MREGKEAERKICQVCGAHKIMRFMTDNACSVCGNSLASLNAIEKKFGCLKHSNQR